MERIYTRPGESIDDLLQVCRAPLSAPSGFGVTVNSVADLAFQTDRQVREGELSATIRGCYGSADSCGGEPLIPCRDIGRTARLFQPSSPQQVVGVAHDVLRQVVDLRVQIRVVHASVDSTR